MAWTKWVGGGGSDDVTERVARRAAYLGLGLPTSAAGVLAAILTVLAAAVSIVPGLGWALWSVAAALLCRLGSWEAWRAAELLGATVPVQSVPIVRGQGVGGEPGVWRQVGYWLVRPLLGGVQLGALTVVVGLPVVGVLGLVLGWASGDVPVWADSADWGIGPTSVAIVVAAALLTKGVAPLTRGLVALDLRVGSALLGSREQELADQVDQLQARRARAVDAAESERRRIERDLHDGAQQRLVALGMLLGRAEARLGDRESEVRALLSAAKRETHSAIVELRALTRGLTSPVLTDRGLDAALSALAGRCPVPVAIDVVLAPRPSATVESVLYFAVAEALTNIAKHSRAARAGVAVSRMAASDGGSGSRIVATVTDDGVGGARLDAGTGLAGLADRLAGVDGTLVVDSPDGGPTVLTIDIPEATRRDEPGEP